DVVVGDEHDLVAVPDLGVFAEMLLEDAEGAGAADVVGHEHVHVDPDVVAGRNGLAAGPAGQEFFGERHRGHERLLRGWLHLQYIPRPGGGGQGGPPSGSANSSASGSLKPDNTSPPVRVSVSVRRVEVVGEVKTV